MFNLVSYDTVVILRHCCKAVQLLYKSTFSMTAEVIRTHIPSYLQDAWFIGHHFDIRFHNMGQGFVFCSRLQTADYSMPSRKSQPFIHGARGRHMYINLIGSECVDAGF